VRALRLSYRGGDLGVPTRVEVCERPKGRCTLGVNDDAENEHGARTPSSPGKTPRQAWL
jgi:hypothetical protein